ncbi:thiosulfate sulfurtransferase/rhodanese-like domain-containing protein 3 [Eriocheir sinensis]|uniref:thiosulfate sulfurtransferase/rhodanese-like domain-containing protein 3 n=1 Tax=Eriocheir sinensis TaxID=95602 RepID=UPI0021C93A1A|nr:thiosulfate sulfurtransferase/rhodanese-like domain-containing protein 3 [Eriocheir sinensis]
MSDIDYSELSNNLDSVVVLDVRNRDEVEKFGQIPGSHSLPLGEMEDALQMDDDDFQDKYGFPKPTSDQKLVTSCMKGGRARKAAETLASSGIEARVYPGSFVDWKAQGGEVVDGKPHHLHH